jgi:hypothetical protein
MWLVLGLYALTGCVIALKSRPWVTKGLDPKSADRN